jgi:acetyl esterase/lipase
VFVGSFAAAGGGLIILGAAPTQLGTSTIWAAVFVLFGSLELCIVVLTLVKPSRQRLLLAATLAGLSAALWLLTRGAPRWFQPDPWFAVNSVIGLVGHLCALLQATATIMLATAAARATRRSSSKWRRRVVTVAAVPLAVLVLLGSVVGVIGSTNGLHFTRDSVVAPVDLPAGSTSTVEYCRPDGARLLMDLSTPASQARGAAPAPVAVYIPGGGAMIGSRQRSGPAAALANHAGALVPALRAELTSRGFVVAEIDYRHVPGTRWPAPLQDAKCALRFLRANAAGLGIDPTRIGVWGSSAGGTLSSLLALTPADPGPGQWPGQSSAVQAVVDMFGPPDLVDIDGTPPFFRAELVIGWGAADVRRSASPIRHVASGAPPFLMLQGTQDPVNARHQTERFAAMMRSVSNEVTLTLVEGAEHGLDSASEKPPPAELVAQAATFFQTHLG